MDTHNKLNMVRIIENGLEQQVKEAITEKFVKEELEKFEKQVRKRIKPVIESITLEGVSNVLDLMHLRDEIRIYIKVNDNDPVEKTI